MATSQVDSSLYRQLRASHPVWSRAFSERQQEEMANEDLAAGIQIPAILMGVMVFGFVSMIISVWLAT